MIVSRMLRPAVALMNRLDYVRKFTLIGTLLLLPIGFTIYGMGEEIQEDIRFAQQERQGIVYSRELRQLLDHLQRHRGMMNAYLSGDGSFERDMMTVRQQIRESVTAIDHVDERLGSKLQTSARWHDIRASWQRMEASAFRLQPEESFDLHSELIRDSFDLHTMLIAEVLDLIGQVKDSSGLARDPDPDSYYMMDTVLGKVPGIVEELGQARGIGSGIAAKRTADDTERRELMVADGMIRAALRDMELGKDSSARTILNDELQAALLDHEESVESFLELLNREIIEAERIAIASAAYYDQATVAIDSGYRLFDLKAPVLDAMLSDRIDELKTKKLWTGGLAIAVFLLLFYLFAAFYRSVNQTVGSLRRTAVRIADGDLSARAAVDTRDELREVGEAFNAMVDSFEAMMEQQQRDKKQIEYMAYYDALTGLPNRRKFYEELQEQLEQARQADRLLAVLYMDLDRFKTVNDTLGHQAGDELLQEVVKRLAAGVPEHGLLARTGGDEFLLCLPRLSGRDEAEAIASGLLERMRQPILVAGQYLHITASIGISYFPDHGTERELLIKRADAAMYASKGHGKNRYYAYHEELHVQAEERLHVESNLRAALERGEMTLYYQPRYRLSDGTVSGVEALARWHHPERGMISPSFFIPIAEESGLIVPLGEWALRTACAQHRDWLETTGRAIPVAVNISAVQFAREEFIAGVSRCLQEYGMEPGMLELELTERIVMTHSESITVKLRELKQLGVRISIDDFGTGFSSLSYLKHFPIDALKIDRTFIQDIPSSQPDAAITKTLIALGRRLQLDIVAEGVENEEQLKFLRMRNCGEAQGYLLCRPLPAADMMKHLLAKEGA